MLNMLVSTHVNGEILVNLNPIGKKKLSRVYFHSFRSNNLDDCSSFVLCNREAHLRMLVTPWNPH